MNIETLAEATGEFSYVIPVYVLSTEDPAVVIWPCKRCFDENGKIEMYSHVFGGVCFGCAGSGGVAMDRPAALKKANTTIKRRVTAARKAEEKRLAFLAKRKADQDAMIAKLPALAELLDESVTGGQVPMVDENGQEYGDEYTEPFAPLGKFVLRLAEKFRYEGFLTEGQQAAVVKAIAESKARNASRAAEKEAAAPCFTGKGVIEGEIVKAEYKVNEQYGTGATKAVIRTDAGFVVYGTIPRRMDTEGPSSELKGRRVRIAATFEPSDRDEKFGFFSRPTVKSAWI